MLCEVCYFFCGRTDSYFEENAKDGTISGRNHLRKELVMKVESSSYEAYLEALEEWKQKMQETQATQQKEENSATDSYVPGISQMDMDIPMPSSTYNAQGMMSGERPPMPPMPPMRLDMLRISRLNSAYMMMTGSSHVTTKVTMGLACSTISVL